MKKKFLICGIIYVAILAISTIYIVQKGDSNYFGYKKHIETVKNDIESKESKSVLSNTNVTPSSTQPQVTPQPSIPPQPSIAPQPSASPSITKELLYSKVSFTRTLKKGMNGEDVKKLQELLINKKMYRGEITGVFQNDTEAAVKKYQKDIKVPADGVLGPSTWAKLLE